jgi:uncharacterized protein
MHVRHLNDARRRRSLRPPLSVVFLPLLAGLAGCMETPPAPPRQVYSLLEARQAKTVVQKWDYSCGAAALATVLTYEHGDKVTEREVAAGMLQKTDVQLVRQRLGFSLLDLKRYANSRGLDADGYGQLTVADLAGFGPTIVPIEVRGQMHFVVFRGVMGDRVLLSDPAFGSRTLTVDQFQEIWTNGIGFTVTRRDGKAPPNQLVPTPQDFWASSRTRPSELEVASLAPPHLPPRDQADAAPPAKKTQAEADAGKTQVAAAALPKVDSLKLTTDMDRIRGAGTPRAQ